MITLILAFNMQHANCCAENLGLKRKEWRYMMHFSDLYGYRPSEHIRVVAYGTEPNSMRIVARSRGFEIIEEADLRR